MKPGDSVVHVKSQQTARVVRVRTLVEVDVDGLHERVRRKTYAAENLRPLEDSKDEPTGVSQLSAGDPRSPEDGRVTAAGGQAVTRQGGAIITHIFRHYPTDMAVRCGLPTLHAFPAVTADFASREDWCHSQVAICIGCAAYPVAMEE